MKCIALTVRPPDGVLHPIDQQLAGDPDVTRHSLHNINLLEDGTGIAVYQLRGDCDHVRTILEGPETIERRVTGGPRGVTAFVHFVANDTVADLMQIFDAFEVGLETPLEFTRDGGLAVQVYGTEPVLQEAIDTVPDRIDLEIRRIGDFQPNGNLYESLTERQRETLHAALEAGYYQVPREATQKEVAERLDRSDGTVGEHLRKIEAKVMAALVP